MLFNPTRLKLWTEQHAAIIKRMTDGDGKPGTARPEQVAGKTGLEILQAMLAGELPYSHIADTMGFSLVEVAPGTATFQGTQQLKHCNPPGTVHGGW